MYMYLIVTFQNFKLYLFKDKGPKRVMFKMNTVFILYSKHSIYGILIYKCIGDSVYFMTIYMYFFWCLYSTNKFKFLRKCSHFSNEGTVQLGSRLDLQNILIGNFSNNLSLVGGGGGPSGSTNKIDNHKLP